MPYKQPFTIIAGAGLGTSYSSLTQIGAIQPGGGCGAAAIKLYANISTGNLVVHDYTLTVMEQNGPLHFGYVYNLQAAKPENIWQFCVASRLVKLPETTRPFGTEAILLESDGHETRYLQKESAPLYYVAPGHNNGTPYLIYHYDRSLWERYHPGTRETDYYDTNGLLRSHRDAKGRVTYYEYDQFKLTAVRCPSGIRYEMRSRGLCQTLYQITSGREVALVSYLFDEFGRLLRTDISGSLYLRQGYNITYTYIGNGPLLFAINQTDSTRLSLFYEGGRGHEKVQRIISGLLDLSDSICSRFIYESPGQVRIVSQEGSCATLHLDDQGRLIKVTKVQGPPSIISEVDETQYSYAKTGQVQTITHLGGGIECFVHEDAFGLLKEHHQPDGQVTKFNYDAYLSTPQCTSKNVYLNPNDTTPLATRFVYEPRLNAYSEESVVLRFIISPEKRVTEHCVDNIGFVSSTRCYLANLFTSAATAPSINEMVDWAKAQDPQAITLSEFIYNNRGQIVTITRYADIDEKGNGIDNEHASCENFSPDDFGNWLMHSVRLQQNNVVTESRRYDGLERISTATDFLGATTDYAYDGLKHTVTRHNGAQTRVEVSQSNENDVLISEQQTVMEGAITQTRLTQYDYLDSEWPILTNLPDGRRLYNFWNLAKNPILSISATQLVTLTIYDRTHNYQSTVRPTQSIDLGADPSDLPDIWAIYNKVLKLCQAADTRYAYLFFDQSQRTRFAVDEENYCIESMYDSANRLIGTVHYAERLTEHELIALKNKQPLPRVIDPTRDRWQSTYFDGDNLVIGEIDPDGWVSETLRDVGGRAVKTTLYHTPVRSAKRSADFNEVRPPASVKDAHSYQFYNAKNQVICAVDPNGFMTSTDYYANDLIKSTITYYQKVISAWLDNPIGKPPIPLSHPEDVREDFTYNAKGQLLTAEQSNQRKTQREYDQLGQLINQNQFDKTIDLTKNTQPDVIRGKRTQRDGWQQIVKQTNAFIAQKMLLIEWDPNLTPEQKQIAINALWQNESTRNSFDPVTGLLCSVLNSLNARTLFYYDNERRLVLSIDAHGKAIEHTYTPFGEMATTRQYFNHIPLSTLNTLTGGFMNDAVRALLISKDEDLLDQFEYDRRGTLIKHTDPAGYVSEFTPNAFKEIEIEKLPVNSLEPSLTITHTFNPRGKEISTVRKAGGLEITTTAEFENPHGQVTKEIDAEGGEKTFDYDFCGNPILAMNNGKVVFQGQVFDAQRRLLTSRDAFNAQTEYRYIQATRTQQLITPVVGTGITSQTNVFNEVIKTSDAQNLSQTLSHEPNGQVATQSDEIGRTVHTQHNSEGWLIEHRSASGIKTLLAYNDVGVHNKTVVDNRTTLIDLDVFYRCATVTNPRGVVTQNGFDKRGLMLTSQVDTTGSAPLNLRVTKKYNSMRLLIEETHGDVITPNQYHVTYQQDAFGRPKSKIIDPAGLNLTTVTALDKVGRVVKHIDQNGAIYRLYYDLSGNKRFKIVANGGVQEWRYDGMNRENYHAVYENSVVVDDQVSLGRLEHLVSEIVDRQADKVTYHFRDANGLLRFSVKLISQIKAGSSSRLLQGMLKEHQYDHQRREKSQCLYATLIDVTNIATFSTQSLEVLSASIKNIAQDRAVYKIYNPAGDCCFSINAVGKLHEERFDAEKRITRSIDYAAPISQLDVWLALTFDDFCVKVQTIANPLLDQVNCHGFDAFGKPLYTVNANGKVIRFVHDESNNLIKEIHFEQILSPVPVDELALTAAVLALVPDPNIDRIKKFTFNNADGMTKIIDALGNEDVFERDALSNIKSHQNRERQTTAFDYDRAKRQVLSTTPAKMITSVALTPDGKLENTAVMRCVKTKRDYDNNNNVTTLLADFEGDQQRSVINTYTPLNRLQTVRVPNVSIDDPSKPASFNPSLWPVLTKDLSKTALYNAKGLLIVEIDEGAHYRFKVYDNQNRLRFLAAEESVTESTVLCSVIGYEYNAFGDKVWETHYATFISVDSYQAKIKGLTLVQVASLLHNSEADQIKWYDYNKNSEWTLRVTGIIRNPDDSKKPSSFYYNPATQDIGTHYRLMQRTLTIFGFPELISTLISPNPETWQHQRIIYDQCNKPILDAVNQRAQLGGAPGFHVKVTTRNAHQEIIEAKDFYTLCPLNLNDLTVPYDAVRQFYLKVENNKPGFDKIKIYTYTLQGKKAIRTLKNVNWASLELTDPKNPSFKNQLTDAVERFTYSAIEKLLHHQLANGATEYHFQNSAGDLIAHASPPRQLSSSSPTAVIPLKIIGVNAHGQAVSDSRYVNGAALEGGIPVATPAQIAPDDQAILKLMDSARGLNSATQNARGVVNASTFSATKQQARTWGVLTSRIVPKTLIRESNFLLDARGRVIGQLRKEDHQLIQATYKQFSPFGDEMLEGPDNATWPLYREQDNSGRTWKTNENKVPTVLLHDLRANVTAEIIAQQTDVKSLTYDQVIPLINSAASHYDDIEITLSLRDENSRLMRTVLPRATPSLKAVINNIPLQVSSSTTPAALSWLIPSASNVDMAFSCWIDPLDIHRLPIQLDPLNKGRCSVDVGSLATDIYTYRIDYSLKAPTGAPPLPHAPVLYQTTGIVGVVSATQNNQRVVARVVEDHKLCLAGVDDLAEVLILQDLRTIGTFPLEPDQGQYWVDLSSLVSGTYSAQAITRSGVTLNASLPFIINTALAPSVPLAREIPALSQLMTLNDYGQLSLWDSLPKDYLLTKVSMRISYLDQNDALQEERFVIDPAAPTTPVMDPSGHELQANIHFKSAVKEIKDCDIQLLIGDDSVMLYQRVVPTGSQDAQITHVLHGRRGAIEKTTVPTHRALLPDGWPEGWIDGQADDNEPWHALDMAGPQVGHQLLTGHEELSMVGADLDPVLIITWSCPPVRIAWLRGLTQTYPVPPTLSYLDVSADHLATWKDKLALSVTSRAIVVDVTGFPAGNYPYIFEGGDKAAPLILSLSLGSSLYSSVYQSLLPPDPLLRHIDYTRDVRGNAVSETNMSGALYDRSFSLSDQLLTETGPVVSIQAADGTVNNNFRPSTQRLYDIRGLFFGTLLPAGNLDAYVLNAAGDQLEHLLGDGTVEGRYSLDGFGRRLSKTLANNAVFSSSYNQSNKLIRYTIPNDDVTRNGGQALIHAYTFNELDQQDQHLDAAGNAWQVDFDSRNNPLRIKTPTGVTTTFTYGRDSFLLSCQNPLLTLRWQPDSENGYFGVIGQYTDGGGCVITYQHNKKGEVIAKRGVGGTHGNMTQIRESTVSIMIKPAHKRHPAEYILCDVFTPITVPTPPVNSEYRYIAGRLMAIKDTAQQINTQYSYDLADRPTSVTLRGFDQTIIHSSSAVYNALGDETQIYNDSLLNAVMTYDANRNVRRKIFDVSDNGRELTSKLDHGFTYDRADRALIVDGAFTAEGVKLLPNQGFETTYVNHQRTAESQLLPNGTRQSFDYSYWQSGEVRTAQLRDTTLLTRYFYHPSGYQRLRDGSHQLYWRDYLKNTTTIVTDAALFQTSEFDDTAVGRYYEQVTTTLTPGLDGRTVINQATQDDNSQSNFSYGFQSNYVNFDSPQTIGVSGWSKTRDGRRNVSSSITHDAHGTVNGKWGVSDDQPSGHSKPPRLIWYVNGDDGTTYQKWYLYAEAHFPRSKPIPLFGIKNVYFYSPRGAYLGSYQNQLPSTLGAGTVAANLQYHLPTSSGKIAQFFNHKADRSGSSRPGGTLTMAENIGRMMTLTTRSASYRHKNHHEDIEENWRFSDFVASDGLSPVPQVVTVKTGDTYDLLAQNIYGTMADASASLAESAGDAAGVIPQVGSQVVTPQLIPQGNKSTDQLPMSRVQQYITGTLLPHLQFAEPHQKKGNCKETIVRVAIDIIAITIAACSGGTASGLSAVLIEAAVAAASDAAMQEIAINVGLLQSFSWQEVITTGIAAGMAAGFNAPVAADGSGGVAANFFPTFFSQFTFSRLIQLMVFAGTVNIMDQLALIAAGKRSGFDVKELLTSIVEAGIAQGISSPLNIANAPQLTRALNEVTDDSVNAFVGSAIMGGSPDIEMAMAQAIGATIGNSVGDQVKAAHQRATEVNASQTTHVGAAKALSNLGPLADSSYYQASTAAQGVGANASATPISDMDWLVGGGLDADDFAMSVLGNSNIPVTSVNQQTPRTRAATNSSSPSQSYTDQNPISPYLLGPLPSVTTTQSSVGNVWGMANASTGNSPSIARSSIGGLRGALTSLGERFENLVVYGKFNTNQEEANYISALGKAYKSGNGQFAKMLRNNSPVSGTINVLEGLASSGIGLLRNGFIEIPGGTETTLYHSVTSASNGQGVLNGINPKFFNLDSRFGEAFYLSANPDTTLAELAHHNSIGVNTIRYDFNNKAARVLDLTRSPLAESLGYSKGVPYEIAKPIAQRAAEAGFTAIRYPSARALGVNIAVFNDFERLLTPRMIVPTPQEFTPEPFTFDLNGNKIK